MEWTNACGCKMNWAAAQLILQLQHVHTDNPQNICEGITEWLPWLHTIWRDSGMKNELHSDNPRGSWPVHLPCFNTSR